jgi:hypothetical protein
MHPGLALLTMHGTSLESFKQLGTVFECSFGLAKGHPHPRSLVHFGPLCFLLLDRSLVKVVGSLGCLCRQLIGSALFGNDAQVVVDFANDAGFFPGLPLRGFFHSLVGFPTALWNYPMAPAT